MKNINVGSVVVVAAVVVVALIILGFISTLLTNIVPLAIVAVVAFILGRMSNNVNYLQVAGNLLKRAVSERPAAQTAKPQTTVQVSAPPAQTAVPETQAASTVERQQTAEANLSDFEIKTEDEILAEARLREQEILKKNTAYDPTAALEERKRRLLNDQQQSGE